MKTDLYTRSIEIILKNQCKNGSYVASPEFDTYHFSWIRDGSFIAYSMDRAGQYDSSRKFYSWVNDVIMRYSYKIDNLIDKLNKGEKLKPQDFLYARYTLEGFEETENGWGNFQLDAYGTWLWGLSEHIKLTGENELIKRFSKSIYNTITYIENLWFYPNFDIWEENSDKIHTSTLACLYGGLKSINEFLKEDSIEKSANRIKSFILTNCVKNGAFSKYSGTSQIDSSLIWLGIPFKAVDLNDTVFTETIKMIREELCHSGGVHRYKEDTYYGGGEWILLSCWLAWYYVRNNNPDEANEICIWIENHADKDGNLPEQVCEHVNNDIYYPYWVSKWGEAAKPLLWSHAMYLILCCEIRG